MPLHAILKVEKDRNFNGHFKRNIRRVQDITRELKLFERQGNNFL